MVGRQALTNVVLGSATFVGCLTLGARASAAEPYCENNPAVIYCNDFESGGLDALEAGPAATVVSAASGAPVFDGEFALLANFTPPYNAEAEFGLRFDGVERVYMRFFVRFDASWDEPMHHWYAIHGDQADDPWSCHGDAGCRPNGTLCLSGTTVDSRVAINGELPGEPFFYTYHPEMSCDPGDSCANYNDPQAVCDGCAAKGLPCNNGLECCWGNGYDINQGTAVSMVGDTWYEIETMVAANTAGVADGAMALWIDGVLVSEHEGIRWRDTDALLLNHVIFWNYYRSVPAQRSVWFDNLVISSEPIGAGGVGSDDGSADDDPSEDDAADSGDGASDVGNDGEGGGPGDDGGGDAADAGGESGAGTVGDGNADGGGSDDDSGCGCTHGPTRGEGGAVLALLLLLRRRRA